MIFVHRSIVLAKYWDFYRILLVMATTSTAEKTTKKKAAPKAKATPKKTETKSGGFAIFTTGGKQYTVTVGDKVKIEKIIGEYAEGDAITFDKVLLVDDGVSSTNIGMPYIANARVATKLVKIGRHAKVTVIKYKQKSRYFKKNGHRQPFFEVEVTAIN